MTELSHHVRSEILDIAEQLFVAKGFDNTSTNDILREIEIARGTLYYYFKSKEDILDAVIGRITEQLIEKSKEICNQKELSVFQRLTMIILALNISSGNLGHEMLEQVHHKMLLCIRKCENMYCQRLLLLSHR